MKKLLSLILVHRVLLCVAKSSEPIDDVLRKPEDVEPFVLTPDDNNNYMYLYKTDDQTQNYLNYRAVYGLRYSPTKKSIKPNTNNYHNSDQEPSFNGTNANANEVISASENETENEFVESETLTSVASSQSSATLPQQSFTFGSAEPAVDESRNHIMRPNNRVEYALDFLSERLKTLLHYSGDKSRPESKLSPHLTSLGRFLNLFSLIKFENIPCITAMKPLRQLSGTCYNEVECAGLGGIAVDRCANGFGVCCVCEFLLIFLSSHSRASDKKIVDFFVAAQSKVDAVQLLIRT
jgi:hypothetical protein